MDDAERRPYWAGYRRALLDLQERHADEIGSALSNHLDELISECGRIIYPPDEPSPV